MHDTLSVPAIDGALPALGDGRNLLRKPTSRSKPLWRSSRTGESFRSGTLQTYFSPDFPVFSSVGFALISSANFPLFSTADFALFSSARQASIWQLSAAGS